jgi:naphtho-gamma-pyrone polyketide synthase
MLLQEGPLKPPSSTRDPRSHLVVCVSARSASSLKNNMRNLAAYIAVHSSVSLEDLSYTTTARRMMHNYRFALSAHDLAQVRNDLTTASEETFLPTEPTNVAFVFTGQGSVYCSLGRALFETSSQFRSTILRCEQLAERQGFPSFTPLIDGSLSELSAIRPLVVHLGIVCVQMALAELYMSWGIQPSAVIGHSIGEYAALYTAGVLSASSVIHIIGNRGRILEERCKIGSHAMLAVKAPESSLAPTLIGSDATVACANSPNETVLAGSQETIDAVAQRLSTWRIKCKKLEVTHAFHSSQMDPIMDRFESVTRSAAFAPPKIPVISSLMGRVVASDELNYNYLLRHTREKVNFLAAVSDAKQSKVVDDRTIWVEIGSHPICIGMLKSILSPDVVGIPSLRKSEDPWSTVSSGLATLYNKGLSIDWSEYHRDFDKAHRLLTLPPYAFDLKK